MKHSFYGIYDNVKIRPLEKKDIEKLRKWRNSYDISRYLSPIDYITYEKQLEWFKNYCTNTNELIFAIEEIEQLKELVGSLALYNFFDKQAEIGKIVVGASEAHGKGVGRKAFALAMKIAFFYLKVNKVVCSVHQKNIAARKIYLKLGFEVVGVHPFGEGGLEEEMEITKERFKLYNPDYPNITVNRYK